MKEIVRTAAFALKELRSVLRQKRLIATLVLGPFLVLLLFGVGFKGGQAPIRTLIVVPPGAAMDTEAEQMKDRLSTGTFEIVGTTRNRDEAEAALRRRDVDAVVILPTDAFATIYNGQPAQIQVIVNQVDPLRRAWTDYNSFVAVTSLNQTVLAEALREGLSPTKRLSQTAALLTSDADALEQEMASGNLPAARARAVRLQATMQTAREASATSLASLRAAGGSVGTRAAEEVVGRISGRIDRVDKTLKAIVAGLDRGDVNSQNQMQNAADLRQAAAELKTEADQIARIPPEVLVSPIASKTENIAPIVPTYIAFYAPSVIALLLQHLIISMVSMSILRERLLGTMEIFRVSPVSTSTIFAGKSISYAAIGLILAGLLIVLVNRVLGVPAIGDVGWLWASLAVLLFASLGIGFLIGTLSGSENQAVQLAMLSLIASTFFGGFFIQLETLRPFTYVVSYLLPVTYGIQNLQDVMLRGQVPRTVLLAAPLALGVVTYAIAAGRFRTQLRGS